MFRSRRTPRARCKRLCVEVLETRNLLSTWLVDHLADDLVGSGLNGSLRYAITNAADNDHITFGVTGTINLTGTLPSLTHGISLEGPGPSLLTVRRDTGGNYSVFLVRGRDVSISGLTISNGSGPGGGGISNSGTLTVSDCTITANVAGSPGSSEVSGGGIVNSGTLTVSACTISSNVAGSSPFGAGAGGGIYNYHTGTLTVSDCTIRDNISADSGGGIYNDFHATMSLSNSTVSGNHAGYDSGDAGSQGGGGILNQGILTVTNSTVSDNQAYRTFGAGIFNRGIYDVATLVISNSTISDNGVSPFHFQGYYGIINGWPTQGNEGVVTVTSCTISGNDGGIDNDFTGLNTLNLSNSIVAGNDESDLDGTVSSGSHNLIGGDPQLGPLQDNGGPTRTMALLPGSPALNAGDPAQLGTADQRGVVRSNGVNIGAYQASASAFVLTAPASVAAGMPFDLTVLAVDSFGQTALGYTGTVTFMTDDPAGSVPTDYTFTAADAGSHTFLGGVTLYADGSRITVTDTGVDTLTGSIVVPLG